MKRCIRIIFLSFMTLPLFIACEKVQYDMPNISGGARLSIDFTTDTTFAFSYEANSSSLAFKSNYTWVAELDEQAPWLTFSQLNGKPGTHDISFSLTKNEDKDTRLGRITLYAGDTSIVITIKQTPEELILERDEEGNIKSATIYVDEYKQDTSYSFYANVEWTATVNEDAQEWIQTEASGLKDETKLSIKVGKNLQTTERTGTITVQSNNHSFDIQVIQEQGGGDEFNYNRALMAYFYPYSQSSRTFNFNARVNWTAKADKEWLLVEPERGDAGDNIQLTISVIENPNFSLREGKVAITGRDSTFFINLSQKHYPAFEYIAKNTKYSFPFSGGKETFEFTANVDNWEIADSPPFSVSPNSGGKGLHTLTITCAAGDPEKGEQGGEESTLRLKGGGQSVTFDCVRGTAE